MKPYMIEATVVQRYIIDAENEEDALRQFREGNAYRIPHEPEGDQGAQAHEMTMEELREHVKSRGGRVVHEIIDHNETRSGAIGKSEIVVYDGDFPLASGHKTELDGLIDFIGLTARD